MRDGVAVTANPGAVIRPAADADLETVAGIFGHYVRGSVVTFETEPPPLSYWRRLRDDLGRRGLPFLVCARDTGHRDTGHRDTSHRDTSHRDTSHRDTGHRDAGGPGSSVRDAGDRDASDRGGQVVGYAYAAPWRARPAYWHTVESTVYLAPGQAGRGLGRRLLEELRRECALAGAEQMIAVIADSGDPASAALHRACGFTEAGRLRNVGRKHGRLLDTLLFQCDLTGYPRRGERA